MTSNEAHAAAREDTSGSPRFSWTAAPDLMARLSTAQNHPANSMIDIMTWAGMCDSRQELENHLSYYEGRAAEYVAPKRRRRA